MFQLSRLNKKYKFKKDYFITNFFYSERAQMCMHHHFLKASNFDWPDLYMGF